MATRTSRAAICFHGLRAIGYCQQASPLATITVTTPRQKFQTIQGCFVATAAFGSPLAAEVITLRAARDRLLASSRLGRALIRLYYAASPPLARLIARDDALRAAARALLEPGVKLARAALALFPEPRRAGLQKLPI